ncbi:hypothetical protein PV08_01838 [Exophiala spinifera]|uniref:Uncharacterized protein n=1 Tax=Exophiala spinifera TaxID=91928 RepID=A0A0D2BQJ5_9EURO|nr:uncharacterized protein PV08_01838 [Exophiala spinifera]KIW21258.1 hypothetical protein PV08_01838 [Exophiala spinifera]
MEKPNTNSLADSFTSPIFSSLAVGVGTGAVGIAYGGVAGTILSTPNPLLYPTYSGLQWFCAGTTFFYCRSILLADPKTRQQPLHVVAASGLSGFGAGAVAGTFLRRTAVIPGGVMLGVLAATSQTVLNMNGGSFELNFNEIPLRLQRGIANLMPMQSLSDKEYEELLTSKLLKIEAQISLLDDQIADLREASQQQNSSRRPES